MGVWQVGVRQGGEVWMGVRQEGEFWVGVRQRGDVWVGVRQVGEVRGVKLGLPLDVETPRLSTTAEAWSCNTMMSHSSLLSLLG